MTSTKCLLLRSTLLAVATSSIAVATAAQPAVELPAEDGVMIGFGIDIDTGALKPRSDCVQLTQHVIDEPPETQMSFEDAQSKHQLATAVTASLGGSYGGVKGSASILKRATVSDEEHAVVTSIQTRTKVTSSTFSGMPEVLDPVEFRTRCGTHYVGTLVRGGELFAVAKTRASSAEQREAFSASFKAQMGAAKANGSFSSSFKKTSFYKQLSITALKSGDAAALPISPDDLAQLAKGFEVDVTETGGRTIRMRVLPYPGVEFPVHPAAEAIKHGSRLAIRYATTIAAYEALEAEPAWYGLARGDREEVEKFVLDLERNEARVEGLLSRCRQQESSACARLKAVRLPAPVDIDESIPPRLPSPCGRIDLSKGKATKIAAFHLDRGDAKAGDHDRCVVVDGKLSIGEDGRALTRDVTARVSVRHKQTGSVTDEWHGQAPARPIYQNDSCAIDARFWDDIEESHEFCFRGSSGVHDPSNSRIFSKVTCKFSEGPPPLIADDPNVLRQFLEGGRLFSCVFDHKAANDVHAVGTSFVNGSVVNPWKRPSWFSRLEDES